MNPLIKSSQTPWVIGLLTSLIVLGVYLPVIHNGFVDWDDTSVILLDPSIRDGSGNHLWQIIQDHLTLKYSRVTPLTYIFYTFLYALSGGQPFAFHLASLVVHLLNVYLVFWFAYLCSSRTSIAFGTALLFGIHPMNVEPVAWVSAMSNVLFACFYLLTLILFLIGEMKPTQRPTYRVLSILAYTLSLLSTAIAVTLPIVLILIDYLQKKRLSAASMISKSSYFLLAFVFGILALFAASHSQEIPDPYLTSNIYSLAQRTNLSIFAIWFYLKQILIPYPLCAIYPIVLYEHQPFIYYNIAFMILLTCIFFIPRLAPINPHQRYLRFGTLFFLSTLILFLHINGVTESIISDRYAYIPSLGIFFMLSYFIVQSPEKIKRYLLALCVVGIISLCVVTRAQIAVWKNTATLWTPVIEQYPRAFPANLSRGNYWYSQGNLEKALEDYETVLRLKPQNTKALRMKEKILLQLKNR
ncbi:MAG: tetratricopeptide repeat protein [Candidatus Omnitrophota bacterium]|nr:tetratricopeptide repeat protein [Candidatus Omnitrophota bacterium]